jgi:hypothetical protein
MLKERRMRTRADAVKVDTDHPIIIRAIRITIITTIATIIKITKATTRTTVEVKEDEVEYFYLPVYLSVE